MKKYLPLLILTFLCPVVLWSQQNTPGIDFKEVDGQAVISAYAMTPTSSENGRTYTKYVDQDKKLRKWDPRDTEIVVALYAEIGGLGSSVAKMEPARIASKEWRITTKPNEFGQVWVTKTGAGRYKPVTNGVVYHSKRWDTPDPPEDGSRVKHTFEVRGEVVLKPWSWIPSGTQTATVDLGGPGVGAETSNEWQIRDDMPRTETADADGYWYVQLKYQCATCDVKADTLAALSPGHDEVTCSRQGCGVEYRACDTAPPSRCIRFVRGVSSINVTARLMKRRNVLPITMAPCFSMAADNRIGSVQAAR